MSNKAVKNQKKAAYAAKEQKHQSAVINWIFGVLIALGVLYAIYSVMIVG